MDWVESQLDRAEWDAPPSVGLLDYVPVGARPLFERLYTEMLGYVDKYPDDERRWFLLLRAWPALVAAPIRRGGGSATEQLLGERQKQASWDEAIERRVAMSANDVKFVPFSIEAGGSGGRSRKVSLTSV